MGFDFLVGCTGFVGSNLTLQHQFSGMYHSRNIEVAFGGKPDLLVYAGVRAEMFLANRTPAADRALIDQAIENIRRIDPKEIVLISTVAVYPEPRDVTESSLIAESSGTAYGKNRRALEMWVESNVKRHLILRLPAIYGENMKKNFLYDFIHVIPGLLQKKKFEELAQNAPVLRSYYEAWENDFFRCKQLTREETLELKGVFQKLGFTALNFTDSRSAYQFYPLKYLWKHICFARENNLSYLNLVPPPIRVSEVFASLTGGVFCNELNGKPYDYDVKTKHSELFNSDVGYIMSREEEMKEIGAFVAEKTANGA